MYMPKGKRPKKTEDEDHDDQRRNEKIPPAEPHHQRRPRMQLEPRPELRGKVLLAGHYYNGLNKPCFYGAVYEHLDDDLSCEGAIGLRTVSEVEFIDEGHAIAWALSQE